MGNSISDAMIAAARELSDGVDRLQFTEPTAVVYNPLDYAWDAHQQYLEKHASSPKKVVFLGMNPGPFGMAQCGVPFGEISLVRDWVGIFSLVSKPANEHPKRPIDGFDCPKSEVSGRRLWGLMQERFETAEAFFADHFVANYCPLVFMEASGKNRTPDKLPAAEVDALYSLCDTHLRNLVTALRAEWVVGVGAFAEARATEALQGLNVKFGRILHPSPASPIANRGWAPQATKQMQALGLWE
ncbi:uracil-DNA glycosylase family protein [Coraliomargarita akajimensis]|uniref:Uracil-DNA glycosylase superfamily n=1 Tax=Coraliomargarita akajimensis (strain DSM 45221 / IAM 15411 / JCM 23193 / KCTC 12865 / 04OKA010-24) TaxID=583355 RepID=D5END9_CORAD|nr:uracil-DNA glycosylase family protein [Coraliomargarita akajimensis]ADE55415.1 Uracil-DNA glycosylase superfamily [Coraliomargarita akajimensis DSM 45221]